MDLTVWRSANDEVIQQLPYQVAEWVAEFGSLTEKLSHYVDNVRLDLLSQETAKPTEVESEILRLEPSGQGQIREVLLYGPKTPWIFARTIVPVSEGKLIVDLGTTPLGSILFSSSEMRRLSLEVRQLSAQHRLYQAAIKELEGSVKPKYLWARRSLWANTDGDTNKRLLLLEIFLPDSPLYQ